MFRFSFIFILTILKITLFCALALKHQPVMEKSIQKAGKSNNTLDNQVGQTRDRTVPNRNTKIILRNSISPLVVPPYIRFCLAIDSCPCLESNLCVITSDPPKWNSNRYTYPAVLNVVRNSGFILSKNNETVDWIGQYLGRENPEAWSIRSFQKVNKLPVYNLGFKDFLANKTQTFISKYGGQHFGFIPLTFLIPDEMRKLKLAWNQNQILGEHNLWIMKPTSRSYGIGVKLVNEWEQVPKTKRMIIQKYITSPFLIHGRKFDFRVHVLVTGLNPLKIYIKDDYKLQISSVKYSTNSESISDKVMHVTNNAVQVQSPAFKDRKRWTMETFQKYLTRKGKGMQKIREAIDDIVVKTIISAEDFSPNSLYANFNRYNGYSLYGFDIILDENTKPWLLEVNATPNLLPRGVPYDEMMRELLNIVGYHTAENYKLARENVYERILSESEKQKQKHFECAGPTISEKNFENVLKSLTIDDMTHLVTAIDEKSQCKIFRRIFPTPNSQKYFKFFPKYRYYNFLLTAWENTFTAGKEQEGIDKIMNDWKMKI